MQSRHGENTTSFIRSVWRMLTHGPWWLSERERETESLSMRPAVALLYHYQVSLRLEFVGGRIRLPVTIKPGWTLISTAQGFSNSPEKHWAEPNRTSSEIQEMKARNSLCTSTKIPFRYTMALMMSFVMILGNGFRPGFAVVMTHITSNYSANGEGLLFPLVCLAYRCLHNSLSCSLS